jgi:eukaryotic-like serine/threonine-protein kinase
VSEAPKPGPEAWARINDLFHRALAEPPDRRDVFLDDACGGDTRLRAEVSSLLAAHDRAGDFIEQPAVARPAAVAGESAPAPDESAAGQSIGPYIIRRVLGEGGMGVVYLALDTRLGREVALKALRAHLTSDPTRRERLRREARVAAALTHPGIATVYALEEIDGHLYIASEFVAGETLRDELRRGPLSLPQAIGAAAAIARAIAAAHDRGIVHRDLKPENIVRTPDGAIKILDFGLARMPSDLSAQVALTGDGGVLGTPAYMSPEQIRGEPVDARSDLFSLGIVTCELVAGVNPFRSGDPASTIARILESEPARLSAHMPPSSDARLAALDQIVTTCLEKRAEDRYASAHQLVAALEGLDAPAAAHAVPASAALRRPATGGEDRALWWWQFHQAATSLTYAALLVPLWFVHVFWPGRPGAVMFLAGLAAAIVAITLRLHLWFTVRSLRSEWKGQHERGRRWLRLADVVLVLVLLAGGLVCLDAHLELAILLIASAAAVLVSFGIIEPTTARGARL